MIRSPISFFFEANTLKSVIYHVTSSALFFFFGYGLVVGFFAKCLDSQLLELLNCLYGT